MNTGSLERERVVLPAMKSNATLFFPCRDLPAVLLSCQIKNRLVVCTGTLHGLSHVEPEGSTFTRRFLQQGKTSFYQYIILCREPWNRMRKNRTLKEEP
jgi:hypothetical protein